MFLNWSSIVNEKPNLSLVVTLVELATSFLILKCNILESLQKSFMQIHFTSYHLQDKADGQICKFLIKKYLKLWKELYNMVIIQSNFPKCTSNNNLLLCQHQSRNANPCIAYAPTIRTTIETIQMIDHQNIWDCL